MFATWAKFVRILAVSKLTAVHGPVIYSNYGSSSNSILYDKESDLYNKFFLQLNSIQTDFAATKTYPGFSKFDQTQQGEIKELDEHLTLKPSSSRVSSQWKSRVKSRRKSTPSAVVIFGSPNTVAHSPKLRLVVMMTLVRS